METTATLTIRSLRARPVNVPLTRPHLTAGGSVTSAPLVLLDLFTHEGITGLSYVFCSTMHWLDYADWIDPVLETPLRIEDGYAYVADTPGSGISWREEAVREYLVE